MFDVWQPVPVTVGKQRAVTGYAAVTFQRVSDSVFTSDSVTTIGMPS